MEKRTISKSSEKPRKKVKRVLQSLQINNRTKAFLIRVKGEN